VLFECDYNFLFSTWDNILYNFRYNVIIRSSLFFFDVSYFWYVAKYAVCAQLIQWDNINVHRSSDNVLVLFLLLLTRSGMCQPFSVVMTGIKFYKNQFLWKLICSMQTDGQADCVNLIAAWHNFFANAPKTECASIVTWNTACIHIWLSTPHFKVFSHLTFSVSDHCVKFCPFKIFLHFVFTSTDPRQN